MPFRLRRPLGHSLVQRQRPPILAVRRQMHPDNPPADKIRAPIGISSPRKPVGIPAAIPFFVVRANDRNHRVRKIHALQNFCAHHWMDLHLFELGARQLSGFGDNRFRHRQLSDVMQNRRRRQALPAPARKGPDLCRSRWHRAARAADDRAWYGPWRQWRAPAPRWFADAIR